MHHDVANDVADVVDGVGVQQQVARNDNLVKAQLLQVHRQQTDDKMLVQSHLDVCASLLLLQEGVDGCLHRRVYGMLWLLSQPAQDRL